MNILFDIDKQFGRYSILYISKSHIKISPPSIHMTSFDLFSIYKNLCKSANAINGFAILKLAIQDPELRAKYEPVIEKHNNNFLKNKFMDSGFDVFVPTKTVFDTQYQSKFIDMKIKTEMVYCNTSKDTITTCAFTAYPRSSISKTPLMLANHTGIIDSGYRGSLIGAFRSFSNNEYIVDEGTRLLQICHPTLCPIFVLVVDESELSSTERNDGGFGSTGV
jgi:dUTPase